MPGFKRTHHVTNPTGSTINITGDNSWSLAAHTSTVLTGISDSDIAAFQAAGAKTSQLSPGVMTGGQLADFSQGFLTNTGA